MRRWMIWGFVALACCSTQEAVGQRRIIELEVAVEARAPLETQQKWMQLLSEIGADRVRSRTISGASGKVQVREQQTSLSTRIKVLGVVQGDRLLLPGKTFRMSDKSGLREYVQKLRDDGATVALAEKKAFGLTSEQLVDISQSLSFVIENATRQQPVEKFLSETKRRISLPLIYSPVAKRAVRKAGTIQDELKGLTAGTALAAVLRPLGLVLMPQRKQGGQTTIQIVDSREAEEHWPVGWPTDELPLKIVPSLLEKRPLEIRQFPLDQTLAAIESRVELAMLFDYNAMARAEIDLAHVEVTFVKESSSYALGLRKMLNQTRPRMNYEIRVDELGKPFLWISTTN